MALPFVIKKFLARSGLARFSPLARRLTANSPQFIRYFSDRTLAAPVEQLADPMLLPPPDAPDVMNLNLPVPRFDSPISASRLSVDRLGNPPANGLQVLREVVVERMEKLEGRKWDANSEVLVTHGATGAYTAALDAFVNPGDPVVLFDPCSPLFNIAAASRRAKVRRVTTWNEDGRTRFFAEELAAAMRHAMMLVIADPGNPTGGVLDAADMEKIGWLARRYDVLVFVDQSFSRYRYGIPATPLGSIVGFENRLLCAGSVSQGWGLGSLRVGWLTGTRALVQACSVQANLSAPFVPTVCQEVASQVLRSPEELFQPTLNEFHERRRYLLEKLRGMGLEPTQPGGGYFTLASVATSGMTGRQFAERLWKEHRVVVGPGDLFGPSGKNTVRISFAVEDGRLREGLRRIGEMLHGKSESRTNATTKSEPKPEAEEVVPSFSRT